MPSNATAPRVTIACGGTGGHLFPGLAVANLLTRSGCDVQLMISEKNVDRQCTGLAGATEIITLPAVGLQRGSFAAFLPGIWKSWRVARDTFRRRRPAAVLAMGGFTSVGPVLAGKSARVPVFLHESNSIPGRANRFLAPWVDHVFVSFTTTAGRIRNRRVTLTGTPVRSEIRSRESSAARSSLGFDPGRPLLLVTGGSQGARAINDLLISSLPLLSGRLPDLQYLHLSGPRDFGRVGTAYSMRGLRAVVRPFLEEMETALAAATLAVSRAGASSIAEFAAARLPAILIPLPSAADNHQWFNAAALAETGAARLLEQDQTTPEKLVGAITDLILDSSRRDSIRSALAGWDHPDAAERIVAQIMSAVEHDGRWLTRSRQDARSPSRTSTGTLRAEAQGATVA